MLHFQIRHRAKPAHARRARLVSWLSASVLSLACLLVFATAAQAEGLSLSSFSSGAINADESPSVIAGERPYAIQNKIGITPETSSEGIEAPSGNMKDATVELPPGIVGNAALLPHCSQQDFDNSQHCPVASQIGSGALRVSFVGPPETRIIPIYNLDPPTGMPAQFGFKVIGAYAHIDFHVRSGGDYGVTATLHNINSGAPLFSSSLSIWGDPGDPIHDTERFETQAEGPGFNEELGVPLPSPLGSTPFISNPTSCVGPLTSTISANSWQNFDAFATAPPAVVPSMEECGVLNFDPSIEAKPSTDLGEAPAGLRFHLHLAQNDAVATSEVQALAIVATEGQFRLGFEGEITADISFEAQAKEVQAALEALPAIGPGQVLVAGGPPPSSQFFEPYRLAFRGAFENTDVEELSAESGSQPLRVTDSEGTKPGSASVTTTVQGHPLAPGANELATAHLRDTKVVLPPSLTVNPSSANGLSSCSPEQVGLTTAVGDARALFTASAAECPPASQIGTVKIDSPDVIDHPLEGSVYLATPHQNPFGSLLAMYIAVDDPQTGVVIKLPSLIEADPQTGQLTATVSEAPQLPFEDLSLEFFNGDAAPLKTGIACGTYDVKTEMVPWSAPEAEAKHPGDSFQVNQGCFTSEAAAPKTTSFEAGTVDPSAGKSSPFVLKLSRPDGSQQVTGIDATLPKGLLAKLAGIPYCSDQALAAAGGKSGKDEQANPSCPGASQVGTVTVGAGAGGHPFYAPGKAYLAGPYKGAPLSLAVVTPAVAGPFDLGTVVVRNALNVDPITAQVHAVSDPFPHILQGIPLDIRSISLTLDRPEFTRNPTSCNPFGIIGAATTLAGQSAGLNQPFQAVGCSQLGFSPKLTLALKGQTKRTGNPAVNAVLTAPPGQANIANTTVILPKSSFIDQSHVNNPCTRVQFNENACPAKSVLGTAVAYSPLLEKPLEGLVYFRSNGGERKLPDIVADLNGQIHVVLVGFIDSVKVSKESSRVRTRFASVPDAPVSKFILKLKGGKRGLIENSQNLCKVKPVANVQMTGQNGKVDDFKQKIGTGCRPGKKSMGKKRNQKPRQP